MKDNNTNLDVGVRGMNVIMGEVMNDPHILCAVLGTLANEIEVKGTLIVHCRNHAKPNDKEM